MCAKNHSCLLCSLGYELVCPQRLINLCTVKSNNDSTVLSIAGTPIWLDLATDASALAGFFLYPCLRT